jgi:hypothetical protein
LVSAVLVTVIEAVVLLHQPVRVSLRPLTLLTSSLPLLASEISPSEMVLFGTVNMQRPATEPLMSTVPVTSVDWAMAGLASSASGAERRISLRMGFRPFHEAWDQAPGEMTTVILPV